MAYILTGVVLLGGCTTEPVATDATANIEARAVNAVGGADVNKDLATLRRVTAPFHSFDKAGAWSAAITPCMTDPNGAGGMGYHYGNLGLIDGNAQVDQPELLLYEPDKNGQLRLVAVEYIIPYAFHSRNDDPPRLFNQDFKRNDTFGLWGLHAWVWKGNPSGMFADWNPNVTCENAASTVSMSH